MGKLYLIAGHGAGDCGACGCGYEEAERVRALVAKIKELGGDNVVVFDTNINWYRNGFNFTIPKDSWLLECHMDSGVSSARGGHVIIASGLSADQYDNNLAAMMQDILPGRASLIVGRNDLANPKRAKNKGINYRLCEFGFITNSTDVEIFNSRMEEIATRVLSCFGLTKTNNTQPTPQPTAPTPMPTKSAYDVAVEIYKGIGNWGNMPERKVNVEKAGYNYSEVQGYVNQLCGAKTTSASPTAPSISYYKACSKGQKSIVDGLKEIGADSSFSNRKNIARANGIGSYTGSPSQNEKLLSLLKNGKLVK